MFEYILAGFTGTFFSYFCVFWSGVQLHACAKGVVSDKVIEVMNEHHDIQERNMDRMERKMVLILKQIGTEPPFFPKKTNT